MVLRMFLNILAYIVVVMVRRPRQLVYFLPIMYALVDVCVVVEWRKTFW